MTCTDRERQESQLQRELLTRLPYIYHSHHPPPYLSGSLRSGLFSPNSNNPAPRLHVHNLTKQDGVWLFFSLPKKIDIRRVLVQTSKRGWLTQSCGLQNVVAEWQEMSVPTAPRPKVEGPELSHAPLLLELMHPIGRELRSGLKSRTKGSVSADRHHACATTLGFRHQAVLGGDAA